MKNPALISKIKSLEALTAEEKSELIALLNNTKKYGLVWEDKPEAVEELLRTQLPVLQEVPERRILAKDLPAPAAATSGNNNPNQPGLFDEQPNAASTGSAAGTTGSAAGFTGAEPVEAPTPGPDAPNHILIEGDNLHALTALSFTHEGKIDVIYIDPPYNTGNKDFKYNDSFVDREDSYRHSKWLSFMKKRLEIAKRLMSEKGVIFISIDDNEQAQLKLLCDEIFGNEGFLGELVRKTKSGGGLASNAFAIEHDYILVYCKNKLSVSKLNVNHNEEYLKRYKGEDEHGRYFWDTMERSSTQTKPYKIKAPDGQMLSGKWFRSEDRFYEDLENGEVKFLKKDDGNWSVQFKQRLGEGTRIRSLLVDNLYKSSQNDLIEIGMKDTFSYPKPLALIKILTTSASRKSSSILDFFAGSGTTLHATMQLNAEDGGHRQCILVTNNENNIAEEVCYERNRRVIQGYANAKGEKVAGLTGNNLRYYRTGFVGNAKTTKNKKQLTRLATELLCIKEDIYTETGQMAGFVFDAKTARCFCANNKYMLVIYDEEMIEELVPVIAAIPTKHKIKIYVFAPGQYPFTEEFEEVLDKVELCALPDAIYKAYASVLPKKTSKRHAADETQSAENQESTEVDLFTTNTPEA